MLQWEIFVRIFVQVTVQEDLLSAPSSMCHIMKTYFHDCYFFLATSSLSHAMKLPNHFIFISAAAQLCGDSPLAAEVIIVWVT